VVVVLDDDSRDEIQAVAGTVEDFQLRGLTPGMDLAALCIRGHAKR